MHVWCVWACALTNIVPLCPCGAFVVQFDMVQSSVVRDTVAVLKEELENRHSSGECTDLVWKPLYVTKWTLFLQTWQDELASRRGREARQMKSLAALQLPFSTPSSASSYSGSASAATPQTRVRPRSPSTPISVSSADVEELTPAASSSVASRSAKPAPKKAKTTAQPPKPKPALDLEGTTLSGRCFCRALCIPPCASHANLCFACGCPAGVAAKFVNYIRKSTLPRMAPSTIDAASLAASHARYHFAHSQRLESCALCAMVAMLPAAQ